jgi:hypothetical protein
MQKQESPRRDTVRPWLLVAAGIAALTALFGVGVLVGSSQVENGSVEAPAIVNQWGEAFVAEDREALAALYAEEATFNCRAWNLSIDSGEIAGVVMHDTTDFLVLDPTTVLVGEEMIVVEYDVVAISPSGKDVATPLIAVFDVAPNGLLAASTIDYDRTAMFPDSSSFGP